MQKFSDSESHRLNFGKFVDLAFYAIVTGAIIFAANKMDKVSDSINDLNQKIAVVIVQVGAQDKRIDRLEESARLCK